MRSLIVLLFVLVPVVAVAQPGSASVGSGSAGSGSAGAAMGSAGSAGSGAIDTAPKDSVPAPAVPTPTAEQLRQTCAAAMNADPTFADSIVKAINEDTFRQHARAASAIAKNERHVILAYAAMWVLAAGFVMFLWRRQRALRREISQLRKDLDAAIGDDKDPKAPAR